MFIDNYASLGVLQAYMFKYDSVHGKAKQYDVKADAENSLLLGGKPIAVYGLKYVHELWHSYIFGSNFYPIGLTSNLSEPIFATKCIVKICLMRTKIFFF